MKKQMLINLVVGLFILIMVILVFILSAYKLKDNITYLVCCDGKVCSNTYYTPEDNQCHLIPCENNILIDNSKCTYDGKNITFIVRGNV